MRRRHVLIGFLLALPISAAGNTQKRRWKVGDHAGVAVLTSAGAMLAAYVMVVLVVLHLLASGVYLQVMQAYIIRT